MECLDTLYNFLGLRDCIGVKNDVISELGRYWSLLCLMIVSACNHLVAEWQSYHSGAGWRMTGWCSASLASEMWCLSFQLASLG